MKKRNKDLDFVYDNIGLNAGIIGGTHLVGRLGSNMSSPQSSKIMGGMDTLRVVPLVHATGGVFGQLKNLERKIMKK